MLWWACLGEAGSYHEGQRIVPLLEASFLGLVPVAGVSAALASAVLASPSPVVHSPAFLLQACRSSARVHCLRASIVDYPTSNLQASATTARAHAQRQAFRLLCGGEVTSRSRSPLARCSFRHGLRLLLLSHFLGALCPCGVVVLATTSDALRMICLNSVLVPNPCAGARVIGTSQRAALS